MKICAWQELCKWIGISRYTDWHMVPGSNYCVGERAWYLHINAKNSGDSPCAPVPNQHLSDNILSGLSTVASMGVFTT